MNVGDPVQITRGGWTGFRGTITQIFSGGWVGVFLAERHRTFAEDELMDLATVRHHRIVTSNESATVRHYCMDCHATRSGTHPPSPPCPGAAA